MPDWNAIVAESLKAITLPAAQKQEINWELAAHLQDLFEHLQAEGLSESEALARTLQELSDARQLRQEIEQAAPMENVMNYRTKTLWFPGLVSLTMASVSLMTLQVVLRFQPQIWWKNGGALVFHIPWLLSLPLCGALGTYLSRRGGGTRIASLIAGLFPAIAMLAVFCILLPTTVLIERNAYVIQHPLYFVLSMLNWTLLPAAFLILGALIVNRKSYVAVSA